MIKPLALAALTLTLPFIPAALGCSSSSGAGDNTGDDTTQHDSGTTADTGTGGNHDAGQTFDSATGTDTGTGGDAAGGTCPASTSGYTGTPFMAITPTLGVCGSAEIAAFIAVCGDNFDQTSCDDWFNATGDAGGNTACGTCIAGTSNTEGAVYTDITGNSFGPNYGACVALTDSAHGTACGTAINNLTDCVGTACDGCGDATSGQTCTDTEFGASGSCASFGMAEQTACTSDFADGGAFDTCTPGAAAMTQDPDWTYIINLICGTGH